MKNSEKKLLTQLVKEEIREGHDLKTAVGNILRTDGSNFTEQTIRNYYKTFSRVD